MDRKLFIDILNDELKDISIKLTQNDVELFYKYTDLLIEWNKKINLTAITDIKDIITKHFVDSLTINKYIEENKLVMDIGTGAGFPGIPLKILNKNNHFILVDSLNKRINFLEEVKRQLNLNNLELIHARVEDLAKKIEYREQSDIVVSRAVANLSTLTEYMLPFVKLNGICICMKGPNIEDEINSSKNAISILGGKIEKIDNLSLEQSSIERNIIIIRKIKTTPNKYPRKAGTPAKQPIK